MNEDFLHYLWKNRLLKTNISTTEGENLFVINPGSENSDSGPDFFNAKIKIDKTIWVGNIEIHVFASDWYKHNHQFDERYNNIILHVVFVSDLIVKRKNNEDVTTLEVQGLFDEGLFLKYEDFIRNKYWIPCINLIDKVPAKISSSIIERMSYNRLNEKAVELEKILIMRNNDWKQTFYHFLAINFGFNLNAVPFELLAKSLPYSILENLKDNQFQLEALLFGQSGLLIASSQEVYPSLLLKEYHLLKSKHSLHSISGHLWNFLRLRPNNFPTIRISQFANLLHNSENLFGDILDCRSIKDLADYFNIECSEYWKSHYIFDKLSQKKSKKLGRQSFYLIMVNTIIPFYYVYGKIKNQLSLTERAIHMLNNIPHEKNSVSTGFSKRGIKITSSFQSQGLLQLKKKLCDHKKCLHCQVGSYLLNRC